jgi:hypothetical protein
MPWFICEMRRESGFEKCEPLFIEQDRMMAAEDWDAAEMPWKRMRTTLNLSMTTSRCRRLTSTCYASTEDETHLRY